jgi:dTDP-glucose 4,6-dehydratase/UDP-glucose 4-epimerase
MHHIIEKDLNQIFSNVSSWEFFRNSKIFITGGTGFFGKWLLLSLTHADQLLKLNLSITVLSRSPENFLKENPDFSLLSQIHWIKGEINSFQFPQGDFDFIFHMATTSASETFHGESNLKKLDLLYSGTKHVLDFAVKSHVKKILFTSSGVVYGNITDINGVKESSMTAPDTTDMNSGLGEGKRVAEYLINYYCQKHSIDFVIARCFSFIGPFMPLDMHYAIGNFILACIRDENIILTGNGTPIRSYLYISDAIHWLIQLIANKNPSHIYNLGSPRPISLIDLAYLVQSRLRNHHQVIVSHEQLGSIGNFARNIYLPNIDKIINELNLTDPLPLGEGIIKTYDYFRYSVNKV